MTVLLASWRYFAVIFAAGFALALVRIPLLVPIVGERWAELLEMPVMLLVIWWAAGVISTRLASARQAIFCGMLALAWLLLTEFTVVLWLRDTTLDAWAAGRDPVAGGAYAVSLVLFALMPWWRARRQTSRP